MSTRSWLQRNARQAGNFRQMLLQFINHLQRALRILSLASGCRFANPGMRATFSFSRELYFIVHEPSGYMPRSIE